MRREQRPHAGPRRPRAPGRLAGALACTVMLVMLLGGGSWSCHASSDNHHHHNNTNHTHPATQPAPAGPDLEAYVLRSWRAADAAGRAPTLIPTLLAIEGPTLRSGEEPTAARLRTFTGRVLEANPDLLGLPEEAGSLAFLRVERNDEGSVALWVHLRPDPAGSLQPVPGSGLAFVIAADGALTTILSTVR